MRRITENKLLRLINEEIQNILQEKACAAVSMQAHQQLASRVARLERAAVAAGWNLKAPSSKPTAPKPKPSPKKPAVKRKRTEFDDYFDALGDD